MNRPASHPAFTVLQALVAIIAAIVVAAGVWAISDRWRPTERHASQDAKGNDHVAHHDHDHRGDSHEHDPRAEREQNSIKLSDNALKNIGYQPLTVALGNFDRTVMIPAIVVEQAGRTRIHMTSPVTGIVSEINALSGEAVEPDSAMFQLRLTHEEVVSAQREYLLTSESLDVVNREIARLESVGEGVIPGKVILEKQYEKQKLEAALLAGEQGLVLHGLGREQIAEIRSTKRLIQNLAIRAPAHSHNEGNCKDDHLFHVQRIAVSQGQEVQAGEELCVLADHCELLVEGRAFEDDAKNLRKAVQEGWNVTATLLGGEAQVDKVEGLRLLYLADHIDPESRAFHFYLQLPNKIVLDQKAEIGHRFIEWRFKPGQRMELRIPLERWTKRIVVPADGVIEEGPEAYVYRQSGNRFDRVPVHVEYRDRDSVVIAYDGSVAPGEVIAGAGAFQIHLALKNKAGGGIDPHAGHQH